MPFSNFIRKGKSLFTRAKEFVLGRGASGGMVNQTGNYQLHAGERVMNAGETSRLGGGGMNYSPNITIQATISNDIDIRMLARKLADYQEREIRRRSSYL